MAVRLRSQGSIDDRRKKIQGDNGTTYVEASLLKMSAGLPVALSGQTDVPFCLFENVDSTPYKGEGAPVWGANQPPIRPASIFATTAVGERLNVVPTFGLEFEIDFTPLIDDDPATSGSTTTAVVAYGGSTNDFNGGLVYLHDQKWQAVVNTSAVSGGAVTLAFEPAAPRAVAANDRVSAIPFGVGFKPKWDATNPHLKLSTAAADDSGGACVVLGVEMDKNVAIIMIQAPI